MASAQIFNPLDYENLTRTCVAELLRQTPVPMPALPMFHGAGIYALFYVGNLDIYAPIRSPDAAVPIYVGKAVAQGGRKGAPQSSINNALCSRLAEHRASIDAATSLDPADFLCRYLAVVDVWITMAERLLITHYQPLWNVSIEGFGNHDPGKGRHAGERSHWDTLHPGRAWAEKLKQTRTVQSTEQLVTKHLLSRKAGSSGVVN